MEREELIRKICRRMERLSVRSLRRLYSILINLEEMEEAGL